MPLLASDFCADHGTVVAQDAVVCSAASSGSVLATQVHMALAAKGMPAQKQILTNIVAQIWLLRKVPRWLPFVPSPSQMVVVAYLQHAGFTLRNL